MIDMGMKKVHLCLNMQYDVTKQVCWKQPRKFQNTVVHPGGMYINSHLLAALEHYEMLSLGTQCHCSLRKSKLYLIG